MFVACGFEHSIANMFMIPTGILIQNFASPEFWIATGYNPADFADLNINNFIFANLIPVTIGNTIGGGLLVGFAYWVVNRRPELELEKSKKEKASGTFIKQKAR